MDLEDFVGKKIAQRFTDESRHDSWWECGRVLSVNEDSDKENPEFVIEYEVFADACEGEGEGQGQGTDEDPEICTFNLFGNDLRFL